MPGPVPHRVGRGMPVRRASRVRSGSGSDTRCSRAVVPPGSFRPTSTPATLLTAAINGSPKRTVPPGMCQRPEHGPDARLVRRMPRRALHDDLHRESGDLEWVPAGTPLGARPLLEARLAIGERAHDTGAPTNFLHDPLEWIVGADLLPMNSVVPQRWPTRPPRLCGAPVSCCPSSRSICSTAPIPAVRSAQMNCPHLAKPIRDLGKAEGILLW